MSDKWNRIKSTIVKIGDKIAALKEKFFGEESIYSKITAFFGGGIPSSQFGGFVPQTGLRLVHAGETVIPSSQNLNFNPTVNITSGVGGGVDANMIKSELNEMWARQLANLARR